MSEEKKEEYIPYNERISIIMEYFNISTDAAKFIYHRKRRSYPFTKRDDDKFLYWDRRLQNALIKADKCIGWDWKKIQFGEEEKLLKQYNIFIEKQSKSFIFKNEPSKINDLDWTKVENKRKNKTRKNKTLRIMGLV